MAKKIGPEIGIDGEKEYRAAIKQIIQQAKTLDAEMKATAASFDKDADAKQKNIAVSKSLERAIANQEEYVAKLAEMTKKSAEATEENSTETLQWREALANAQAELGKMQQSLTNVVSEMEQMDSTAEDALLEEELNRITQEAKTLNAEMKATAASFDKDTDAKKKNAAVAEMLEKQIENQKSRVNVLTEAVSRSAMATGENSTETLQWREALANAQAELGKMQQNLSDVVAEMENMDKASEETAEAVEEIAPAADEAAKSSKTFGDTLKAVLSAEAIKAGVKAVVNGFVEIGKAAASFGKEVVMAYADFEQLEGGVEKLFGGNAAQAVIKNAENAFKTAGLSANEYMETVTGFSAALINSLGGDTAKAAELADLAIRDMSDNANTFGTDMESIQNAYAGFAKGQFNMLDNLKLGYAGSKEGMQQLLADAEALSGVHYDVSSYADIVQAIHVVQENMNIAGTTAREAAGTISGSIDALKSSFQNFVIGLGQDGADIDMLFNNMVESFGNVVNNVQPVIERLIDHIPGVVANLLPVVSSMLPQLTQTAAALFNQVVNTILALLPDLIPVAVQAISTIADGLISNLPMIVSAAVTLVLALVDGIADGLPLLLEQAPVIIVQLIDGLLRALPRLVETGANLVGAIAEGIISFAGGITEAALQIRLNIATLFQSIVSNAAQWGEDMMINFANGIAARAKAVFDNVIELAKGVTQLLHFSEPDKGPMANFHTWAPDMMKLYAKGIRDNAYRVQDAAEAAASGVEVGLSAAGSSASQNAYNYGGISMVINQQPGESAEDLVDRIMYRIQTAVDNKEAVFA